MKKTITIDSNDTHLTEIIVEWEKKGWKLEKINPLQHLGKVEIIFWKKRDLVTEKRILSVLTEYFPAPWVQRIHETLRDTQNLNTDDYELKVSRYLAGIAVFLAVRGLTILDSTLDDLNHTLKTNVTKKVLTQHQEELTSLFPNLHLEPGIRKSELLSTILFVLKNELQMECTRSELFQISQTAFYLSFHLAKESIDQNVDDLQTLARAICLQATRQVVSNASFPFPHLPPNVRQIIEQKCLVIQESTIPDDRN